MAEAGYFAVAPNQRGYAPGARPDPGEPVLLAITLLLILVFQRLPAVRGVLRAAAR